MELEIVMLSELSHVLNEKIICFFLPVEDRSKYKKHYDMYIYIYIYIYIEPVSNKGTIRGD
jgi:hypothetical protein